MTKPIVACVATASLVMLAGCQDNSTEDEVAALRTQVTALQDRDKIQDMLFDYYSHLGSSASHDLSKYFTEDAVFEVNGAQFDGRQAIQDLYDGMRDPAADAEAAKKPSEMQESHATLLSNPIVVVNGDTATAKTIWTGTGSDTAFAKPALFDQGREYDKLEKQDDGSWLIKKRVIIADSFLPRSMLDTWERKPDYDIGAE